jgi:hypothetical protein
MQMSKAPYLSDAQIEHEAAQLLAEYAKARSVVLTPRIPIEDIVEKHLKLGVEFDDMHRLLNHPRSGPGADPDILGAIFFGERRIAIDESLDPEENPSKEGRYRFTLAHEGGGHWCLHRHLFDSGTGQSALFDVPATPPVVCRSSQAKERIEWQADYFASCLLMPRRLVANAWQGEFGTAAPFVLDPRDHLAAAANRGRSFSVRALGDVLASLFQPDCDRIFDGIARRLAPTFLVSTQAMRIRLETLGYLRRQEPAELSLHARP